MPPNPAPSGIRLADLAARIGATLDGDGDVRVDRVATLENAGPGSLAFLASARYRGQLATTRASAVILAPAQAGAHAAAQAAARQPVRCLRKGRGHPVSGASGRAEPACTRRRSSPTSAVGRSDRGDRAPRRDRRRRADRRARADRRRLRDRRRRHARGGRRAASERHDLRARASSARARSSTRGAVIGSDGFGMAEEGGRWLKIPQVGRVVIGADCEIGANTTIDRGAIDDTVIEDDVKLDNQIQIGHNCIIGAHTAIAGCVGIAGSTRIGRNCKIGGAAMISGHLRITDNTVISGCTGVFHSIDKPGVYTGAWPALPHREWQYAMSATPRLRTLERAHRRAGACRRLAMRRRQRRGRTNDERDPWTWRQSWRRCRTAIRRLLDRPDDGARAGPTRPRAQERHGQRAVLPGAFPGLPGDARRAGDRGAGAAVGGARARPWPGRSTCPASPARASSGRCHRATNCMLEARMGPVVGGRRHVRRAGHRSTASLPPRRGCLRCLRRSRLALDAADVRPWPTSIRPRSSTRRRARG